MDQRPEQPPEGKLIEDAASQLSLSIREAARRAGISYGRWRQIVQGYQNVSVGSYASVRAPARTLARMATAVGVTPEQMEAAGRVDVADAMRRKAESREVVVAFPPRKPLAETIALHRDESDVFPQMDEQMTLQVERHLPDVEAAYIFAVAGSEGHPGVLPRGDQVFPHSPHEAERWDTLIKVGLGLFPDRGGFSVWQMVMLASVGRVRDDERRAGNPATRAREA
jgi:hypothetical protein